MFLNDTITQISPNIFEDTSTGYLICKNVVLGRTGVQKYKGWELGNNFIKKFDKDGTLKDTIINLYRDEDEVFKEESLSSLEDKAFVVSHPSVNNGTVDITNDTILRKGICKNAHKAFDNESSKYVIKGDIIVTDAETIELIKSKQLREVSLGYDLNVEQISQTEYKVKDIKYNHCALVYKGRAGIARIVDKAYSYNKKNHKGESVKVEKRSLMERIFGKKISDEVANELLQEEQEDVSVVDEQTTIDETIDENSENSQTLSNSTETQNIISSSVSDEIVVEENDIAKENNDTSTNDKTNANEIDDEKSEELEEKVDEEDDKNETLQNTSESLKDSDENSLNSTNSLTQETKKENVSMLKDVKLSVEEINALPDGEVKSKLLDAFKNTADEFEDAVKANDTNTQKVSIYDAATSLEKEREDFYFNKINPHRNPNYLKETLVKDDIQSYLKDYKS